MKAGCGRRLHAICITRSVLTALLNKLQNKKKTEVSDARTHIHEFQVNEERIFEVVEISNKTQRFSISVRC